MYSVRAPRDDGEKVSCIEMWLRCSQRSMRSFHTRSLSSFVRTRLQTREPLSGSLLYTRMCLAQWRAWQVP
jgi:hypothetical protein